MRIKKPATYHELFFTYPVLSSYRVVIVFTEDIPAAVAYLADRDFFNIPDDDRLDNCFACHLHPGNRGHSYLIFKPTSHAGAIAHECWHVIFNLMKWAGIEPEDEFVAYHLGYAVQQVVAFQYVVQRRLNVNSRRVCTQAGAGRVGRSCGNSTQPKNKRSTGIHGAPKVRGRKTRTRQTDRQPRLGAGDLKRGRS